MDPTQKILDDAVATITDLETKGDGLAALVVVLADLAISLKNDPTALVAAMEGAKAKSQEWLDAINANTPGAPIPPPGP